MFLTSTLSSSTSPLLRFRHAYSMAVMYSQLGRHSGTLAKLGPWTSRCSWTSVKGVLDRFLTKVLWLCLRCLMGCFYPLALDVLSGHFWCLRGHFWHFCGHLLYIVFPIIFSNLTLCHSKTLLCLASIILYMNSLHSSMFDLVLSLIVWCKLHFHTCTDPKYCWLIWYIHLDTVFVLSL